MVPNLFVYMLVYLKIVVPTLEEKVTIRFIVNNNVGMVYVNVLVEEVEVRIVGNEDKVVYYLKVQNLYI